MNQKEILENNMDQKLEFKSIKNRPISETSLRKIQEYET